MSNGFAANRNAQFQQAIKESSQRIAEAAESDNPRGYLPIRRMCCGTERWEKHHSDCRTSANKAIDHDREPVQLGELLARLQPVVEFFGPVSAGVIADARRMRDHAVAIDAESGGRGGALAMFEHNNPGLAALLKVVDGG